MDTAHVALYRNLREQLRARRLRGEDTDFHERTVEAVWQMMSERDQRSVLGVGDGAPERSERRAA